MFDFALKIVYYPHMATVIERRRADGRVYYYLVESARVDGKPRIVSQQYHDGGKGRPRAQRLLTDMSPTQRHLFELFNLNRYAPTR